LTTDVPARSPVERLVPELDQAVGWRVLLVEDDDADALIVRELLADGLPGARVDRVTNLADALRAVRRTDCVVLDMGLPDAEGITGVERLVAETRDAAVVVLTGAASELLGVRAVAAGAQDYLVKGRVDDQLLARSIRYAVERQRAARLARDLFAAERRRADNTRMERALIPSPLLRSSDVTVDVRYRAGREDAELGGDFYDTVESSDGTVAVLIGDVAGHGPDAAALGARLRSAWRALTIAGLPQSRVLAHLDEFLRTEVDTLTFATVAVLDIASDRAKGRLLLAGHPPPVVLGPPCGIVGDDGFGHLLGVMDSPAWNPVDVALGPGARVLLYTDGLTEGRATPDGPERFGEDRLLALVDDVTRGGLSGTGLLDVLLARVQRCNGGPLSDDVAMCLVTIPGTPATDGSGVGDS
jgi:serine phosphatase RsbU (regulator of sigma subunit)